MSLSGFAGGASNALERVLAEEFLKAVQRKKLAQDDRSMDMQGERDAVSAELGRGSLGVSQRNASVNEGNLGVRRDEHGQRVREYDDGQAGAAEQGAALEKFLTGLPAHMQPVARGKAQFGVTMSPEDLTQAPETREQKDAREFGNFQKREGVQLSGQLRLARERPQGNERIVQIEGPDGRPTWVRESDAVGKSAAQAARAVTGAERGVLAYFNRAKDAENTISAADQSGSTLEDRVSKAGLGGQLQLQHAPNMLQTSDQQAYRQAQRAFTEARLRKESGAAIPTAEYENDAKTYFAQPGDTPETIAQKRMKRQTVLEGLKFSSGRAYDEFYGETNKSKAGSTVDDLLKKYGG